RRRRHERDPLLDALRDRVRGVVEQRRHQGERAGLPQLRERRLTLEAGLDAGAFGEARRQRARDPIRRPAGCSAAEKDDVDAVEELGPELLERSQEEADAFPLAQLAEEREA